MNDLKKMLAKYNKKPKDLANYLGVEVDSIYSWQSGRRDISTENIIKIAQFLDCTTDELLGYTPSNNDTYVVDGNKYRIIQAIDNSGMSDEAIIDLLRTLGKHKRD